MSRIAVLLAAALGLSCAAPADAAERGIDLSSLILSADDLRALAEAMAYAGDARATDEGMAEAGAAIVEPEAPPVLDQPNLHLSAILYYDPQQWSIWINGYRIEHGLRLPTLRVERVTADYVDLLVGVDQQPVRLQPNQTFVGAVGQIYEGHFR